MPYDYEKSCDKAYVRNLSGTIFEEIPAKGRIIDLIDLIANKIVPGPSNSNRTNFR